MRAVLDIIDIVLNLYVWLLIASADPVLADRLQCRQHAQPVRVLGR